jgi:hypothetical protein
MQRAQRQFPTIPQSLGLGAALLLGLCGTGPATAQVYKSIDADGNVVYSSSPPAAADPDAVQTIRIDPPPSAAEGSAAESRLRRSPRPDPGAGQGQAEDAAAKAAERRSKSAPQQVDEAVQRAGQTGREQRSSGGFGGEDRGRSSGSISSGRSSR